MMTDLYRVLHVEDDTDYAEMFALQVSRLAKKRPDISIQITHVTSVQEALDVIDNERIHLVISDYQLKSSTNGLDLLKAFRERHNYLPFIFLTGQGDESVARDAFFYKATDYYTKDVGIAGYERIFNAMLQHILHHKDASLRRALERASLNEANRLHILMETIPVIVVSLDTEGNIVLLNKFARNLLGYESEAVMGKNWFDLAIPADIQAYVKKVFIQTMEGTIDPDEHPQHVVLGKGGVEHIVSWHNVLLYDDLNECIGIVAMGEDVTNKLAAEQRIMENECHFRRIVETSIEGIWEIDGEGYTTFVNAMLCSMLGYDGGDMLGQHVDTFIPPEYVDDLHDHIRKRRRGVSEVFEFPYVRKNGNHLWCLVSATPIIGEGGEYAGSLAMLSDISQFRAVTNELKEYKGHLEHLVSERTAELLAANSELAQEVKARKELERSLREREEHYRNIIEIAQEGIIVVDAAGVITFANTMMETILGIGHDKIVGMHFSDFVQDDRRQFVSAQLQMREGGVSGKYEIELISAGDAPVYVLVSSTPLYGDEHQFVGSLKMISDLTSIKSAQQRIEELGAFYSHILENIINGVWVTDSTDTLIYANKGFCDISGLSLEQLIGRHLDSFSPLAIKYFKPYYQSAKESLAPVQYYEIYVFTPLGRDSYQSGWIVPLTKDGCYDGMICTVEDSTEKKLARDLLQKTEQQYLALARTSTGLVRIDSDYAIMEANKPFWKMVGYTDAPLEQHSLLDFVATEDHDAVRDVFSQARGLGKYHNFELACRLPSDEERYLLFNIAVGDSPTDDSFYAVVRDITLRKTMEHDVLQQKEELSRFAHTVSHDLRNQIGIIRAYAELLVDECKDSSIPGRIKATTEKMTGFIERQLQLAEAGKAIGAYSTFDIRELVKELRQTYGVTIECESCCPLQGDRFRLEHMVVNLVQNAVTHGKATVVSIASTQTDEGFLLTVSDNGCGIDPRIQDTIFDMGVSTGGTGFGLPIVKHIVKAHNGTIDFMTDPAEGTTFNIFIPYAPC